MLYLNYVRSPKYMTLYWVQSKIFQIILYVYIIRIESNGYFLTYQY